jgi:hypothetical protein
VLLVLSIVAFKYPLVVAFKYPLKEHRQLLPRNAP